jgi:hypothetical protein
MLKMAKRAERAAAASGTDNAAMALAQREMLAGASAKAAQSTKPDGGVGGNLADSLAGGQLLALKRAQAAAGGGVASAWKPPDEAL